MGIKMDHGDIARICGISPVTIQKCLKRMQPSKEKLLAE
jgi:predicted DNA binding protein